MYKKTPISKYLSEMVMMRIIPIRRVFVATFMAGLLLVSLRHNGKMEKAFG